MKKNETTSRSSSKSSLSTKRTPIRAHDRRRMDSVYAHMYTYMYDTDARSFEWWSRMIRARVCAERTLLQYKNNLYPCCH